MATIKEVAEKCNVSIATVSNILNGKPNASEETKKRVLKAIKELNYTPNYVAKNLKTKTTQTIGVVVEDMTVFCVPEIIDGITQCCEEKGYHVLLTNLRLYKKYSDHYYRGEEFFGEVQQAFSELISKQVDGIIYVTAHERELSCIPEELRVPAVMAYGYTKSIHFPSVVVDDKRGAYDLVDYIISQGHKKIGVITGKPDSIHTNMRMIGYQKALYNAQIYFNPDYIATGDWSRESGYYCTDALLKEKVSAIFAMNDIMAGGVYDRLEELGIQIGKEIAVVGYDNRELSGYCKPQMTTAELPLHKIGYQSCKLVIEMLEQKQERKREEKLEIIEIPCTIQIRQSVGKRDIM